MRGRLSPDERGELHNHCDVIVRNPHALGRFQMSLETRDAVDAKRRTDTHEFLYPVCAVDVFCTVLRPALPEMSEPISLHDLGSTSSHGQSIAHSLLDF